jgi:gas vesicle protein
MENRFKKGLLMGGILTTLAIVGLAMTKTGIQLSDALQDDLKALTKKVKKHLSDLEDITEEKYDEMVGDITDEYDKKRKWASEEKKSIISALREKWGEMVEIYENDKEHA